MKRPLQSIIVLLGCAALAVYFGYHTLYGKHGLRAQAQLVERRAYVEQRLEALEAVHARLRRDIALLNPDAPDADLIEELARARLGFAFPDETILVSAPPAR